MEKIIVTTEKELHTIIEDCVRKAVGGKTISSGSSKEEDKIFGIQEAAQFLQLAPQTIYGMTSKREIPFLKKGKKLYFKKSELEKWLTEGRKKTRKELEKEIKEGDWKGTGHV